MPSSTSPHRRTSAANDLSWDSTGAELSEEASHREHCAALDATLFRRHADSGDEVVFELDKGCLRLQGRRF